MINPKDTSTTVQPPQLIRALRTGFDVVANHIGLILFPIVLDLLLWLGPRVSLKTLIQAVAKNLAVMPGMNAPGMADLLQSSRQLWEEIADHLNVVAALRTYPIGVPSLMADQFPPRTPLGTPPVGEITTLGSAVLAWLGFLIIGFVAGALYFNAVAQTVNSDKGTQPLGQLGWVTTQTFFLALIWLALILIISLPVLLLLSILAIISVSIAQIAMMLISLFLIWLVIPLLFSPHGIFLYRQNALFSMLTSARLVRFVLPGTGLFFLTVVILSQGLDLLWLVPPPDSWMGLIGVFGHGFIATATLAASFAYYRDAVTWVQALAQRAAAPNTTLKKA